MRTQATTPTAGRPHVARPGQALSAAGTAADDRAPDSAEPDIDLLAGMLAQLEDRLDHRGNDDHRLAAMPGSSALYCPGCHLRDQAAALRDALATAQARGLL